MSKSQMEKMSLIKKLNLDPSDPYVSTYIPHLPSLRKSIPTKAATRNFKAGGLGKGIRKGDANDNVRKITSDA